MTSLEDLSAAINTLLKSGSPLSQGAKIVQSYQGNDWKSHCQFQADTFCRQSIYYNDKFEIVLICWEPEQATEVHDHPDKGCLLRVLQGRFNEERYEKESLNHLKTIILENGQVSYIQGDTVLHKVRNIHPGRTVSLHIYSPPHYEPIYYI